jgi:hypothetical protein
MEPLSDTTPEARRVYFDILRRMTPAERVQVAMELTAAADELLRAGVRRSHPEAQGEEFDYQVLRARYGQELADKVYPQFQTKQESRSTAASPAEPIPAPATPPPPDR